MKTKIHLLFAIISLVAIAIACNRPVCKNANPLFDKYSPESMEYKNELVKHLAIAEKSKLTYWFNQYVKSNEQEQLFFNVQGDGLCAVIVLNVDEWNKVEELRNNMGVGFRGAEFKNLQFDTRQDFLETTFILRDFERIID